MTPIEQLKQLTELRAKATAGPWESSYCHIFTTNKERNSQADVTENGQYKVGDFTYFIADVEAQGGDTPTVEGAMNANFIEACGSTDFAAILAEMERLQAIVSRLPMTADGVPVLLGMELFYENGNGEIVSLPFAWQLRIADTVDPWDGEEWAYSTRAAAESAAKGKT